MCPEGRGQYWGQNDKTHGRVHLTQIHATGGSPRNPGINMEEKRPKNESQGPSTSKCCKDELAAKEMRSGQFHRRRTRNGECPKTRERKRGSDRLCQRQRWRSNHWIWPCGDVSELEKRGFRNVGTRASLECSQERTMGA